VHSLPELILVGPVPPPTGGVATHVVDLAGALVRRGARPRLVRDRRVAVLGELWPARGAFVHLHVCGHNGKSYALTGLLAARPGRTIVTLHSGLAPAWLAGLRAARRRAARAVLRAVSAVVCVSEAVAEAVGALGVPDRDLVIAPAFIAEALQPGRPPQALLGAPGRVVACAVAPGAEYGAELLGEAFSRIAPLEPGLSLAVYGPGGAPAEVARFLAARGLGARVHDLGELRRPEALGVLTACDLFVRPTLADGDAVSVREARALGCRVVASDAATRPAGCLLFPQGDAGALAAALRQALAAPPPPAVRDDGLAALLALYERLGIVLDAEPRWETPCAESPAA